MQVRIKGKLIRGKGVRCPVCRAIRFDTPDGMCCSSGANSGYQYQCRKCGIWFVDTFDGRIIMDQFLTTVYPNIFKNRRKVSSRNERV